MNFLEGLKDFKNQKKKFKNRQKIKPSTTSLNARMATDKTHVGFVSENRHDFVGFSLPTQPVTNIFKNRHGVGFLSAFCRFSVGLGHEFSTKQGSILIYFGRVHSFWKQKILKSL